MEEGERGSGFNPQSYVLICQKMQCWMLLKWPIILCDSSCSFGFFVFVLLLIFGLISLRHHYFFSLYLYRLFLLVLLILLFIITFLLIISCVSLSVCLYVRLSVIYVVVVVCVCFSVLFAVQVPFSVISFILPKFIYTKTSQNWIVTKITTAANYQENHMIDGGPLLTHYYCIATAS